MHPVLPADGSAKGSQSEIAVDANVNHALDRLSQKIKEGYVFTAEMTHRFTDGFTKEEVESSGSVWVGAEQYKILTEEQHIAVRNDVSTVFNVRQNRVILSPYYPEDDDFAPSRFIGSYSERFEVVRIDDSNLPYTRIHLRATDPFEMITTAILDINPHTLILSRMTAEDQTDNVFEIEFHSGMLQKGDADMFRLTWPERAEIIDLRD